MVACYEYPTLLVFSFGQDLKSIGHSCPVLAAATSDANTAVRGYQVSEAYVLLHLIGKQELSRGAFTF